MKPSFPCGPVLLCCVCLLLPGCGQNKSGVPDGSLQPSDLRSKTAENSAASPPDELNSGSVLNSALNTALDALARGDLVAADQSLRQHLLSNPDDLAAMAVAVDIAVQQGRLDDGLDLLLTLHQSQHVLNPTLLESLATALVQSGRPFDAVSVLEIGVTQSPNNPQSHFDLVGLSTMIALPDKSLPSLHWLAQHNLGDPESLLVLADPASVEPDIETCAKWRTKSGDDHRTDYCLARRDAQTMNWESVAKRLESLLEQHPKFSPAYVLYGRALTELNRFDSIPSWHDKAPQDVAEHSEYWLTAGHYASQLGRHDQAARAFWQAIRHGVYGRPQAMNGLYQSLTLIGRQAEAQRVAEQIAAEGRLRDTLEIHLERKERSQSAALDVADALLGLGRIWESEGWARLATSLPNDHRSDLRERYMNIRSQLAVDTPWIRPDQDLMQQIELDDLPNMAWDSDQQTPSDWQPNFAGQIRLSDEAKQRGWVQHTAIAAEALTQGHWIYQSVGGGVGVIDYDLDGWPDLASAMLDGTPLQSNSSPNVLARNLAGRFVDHSSKANYLDYGFAQGITVGDYNDDGWPDLFDSNFDQNRLYRNNGDGTFSEVAAAVGLNEQSWTTSAVIADLNSDGHADIYCVNYCEANGPLAKPCRNESGFSTCPPLNFQPEPDRVWMGTGDGRFVDVTSSWMDQRSPGRGLGLIAGLIDERPGLDVYVANDMTVNHLWSSSPSPLEYQLTDLAAIRGLGFSGQSHAQASMGIAAADADGDGDLDFFLTHFADDHNTYYEQTAPGLWSDRSFQVGLGDTSMKLLGFGTEWIDLDNNGNLELFVSNGHVDDVNRSDVGYEMPPQVYERRSTGRWEEIASQEIGDYCAHNHLGRALATLDADRNGLTDIAVTHLYEPVSLLINHSAGTGMQIGFTLKATTSQRDAIGALVTATVDGRTVSGQMTAGDGYMCSDERRLSIATGKQNSVQDVTLHWPSGLKQSLGTLPSNQDYLLIEGIDEAFPMSSD